MKAVIWKSGSVRRQGAFRAFRGLAAHRGRAARTGFAAFTRGARRRDEDSAVALLGLKSGDRAADVGCGYCFYTIPLARFLGLSGRVYAEDISNGQLSKLKQHLGKEGLKNVDVIKGALDYPKLPKEGFGIVDEARCLLVLDGRNVG
jgi:ubiquinone/menaquinone biosynthesis C-methylase UbiE